MRDWSKARAKDVMSSPVRVIERDLSLEEAMRILSEEEITGAPVVSFRGEPVGVVSLYDIAMFLAGLERSLGKLGHFYFRSFLRFDRGSETYSNLEFEDDLLKETKVDEIMTPEVIAVAPDAPIPEVVKLMAERGIHRVLVTDGEKLEGVITTMDVMKLLAGQTAGASR